MALRFFLIEVLSLLRSLISSGKFQVGMTRGRRVPPKKNKRRASSHSLCQAFFNPYACLYPNLFKHEADWTVFHEDKSNKHWLLLLQPSSSKVYMKRSAPRYFRFFLECTAGAGYPLTFFTADIAKAPPVNR